MNTPVKPPVQTVTKPTIPPAVKLNAPKIVRDEPITPPSIMLLGDTGSGKTDVIISALEAGLRVFVLVTENTGVESLIDSCRRRKVDMTNLHWKRCTPTQQAWSVMKAQAKLTNTNNIGELQKLEAGLDRFKYPAFIRLIETCEDFVCDRTKEHFGDVMTWGDDTLLVLDSQSGLNEIVGSHVTGHRITMTQPEFGVVQNHIYNLINTFCSLNCFFMVTGHLESEVDEVRGTSRFMVSTVGKKLAPKLPRLFSEVVLAREENGKYFWSTNDTKVATKSRALPKSTSLPADFGQIVEIYRKRKEEAANELIKASE